MVIFFSERKGEILLLSSEKKLPGRREVAFLAFKDQARVLRTGEVEKGQTEHFFLITRS